MILLEALQVLTEHQHWRLGAEGPMTEPKLLTDALDLLLEYHKGGPVEVSTKSLQSIDEARFIMESFDKSGSMTVGFDEESYTLSKEQMISIAGALYLAECDISNLTELLKIKQHGLDKSN